MIKNNFRRKNRLLYGGHQLAAHFLGHERSERWLGAHRRRLRRNMQADLARFGKGELKQVDRVCPLSLSLEDFRSKYQRPGVPVIFDGAARDWGCCRKWSLSYFADKYGDDLVYCEDAFQTLRDVSISQRKGDSNYLQFYALLQRHPELLVDLDLGWLKEHRNPNRFTFDQGFQAFIGNANTNPTSLHNANDANLFIQISGKKHWIFYPSASTAAIDPPPIQSEYRTIKLGQPHFDPFSPDYDRFPMFEHLDGLEAVLKPGDILWNPAYAWHTVRNLEDSTFGVGYRWVTPASCFQLEPLYAALDCLATKPPIWRSLSLSRQSFRLLFLSQSKAGNKLPGYDDFHKQVLASFPEYEKLMAEAGLG